MKLSLGLLVGSAVMALLVWALKKDDPPAAKPLTQAEYDEFVRDMLG